MNFSFKPTLFEKIKKEFNNVPEDINDAYLKITRAFMKKAWILMYFFGATPLQLDEGEMSKISLRNTEKTGFSSTKKLKVDLTNKNTYLESIKDLMKDNTINAPTELYIPIRIKSKDKYNILEELKKDEIDHIEVRLCDINPFDKCGVSIDQMNIFVLFIIQCLIEDEENFHGYDYKQIAEEGFNSKQIDELIDELKFYKEINEKLELVFEESIDKYLNNITRKQNNIAEEVIKLSENEGLLNGILNLAKNYSKQAEEVRYKITNHPMLEPSTQILIKDAITRGINYNIIDEKNSFVEFDNGKIKQCVIQASKTSKDTYIFPFITDDKIYAKKIMKENGIDTPQCKLINNRMSKEKIDKILKTIIGKEVVIKPRTTNYGDGITIIDKNSTYELLTDAIKYAFTFDTDVLIEEYTKGKEYRFLVIDGKCIHVSWRRPTNVVGDGISTIQELIQKKTESEVYTRFERKIVINDLMINYLKEQGYSLEYRPKKDERIYLHKISNVSKGGEGVGVNEIMPDYFKKIAEKVAKAFDAKIAGVDIIIDDLNKNDYKVIEINDNPGFLSNEYPVEGNGAKIGIEILKLLNLIEK